MSFAGETLITAAMIVAGDRNVTHGDKERSFEAIARMWTAFLAARKEPGGKVRPSDVAQMMVLLKQQRAEWGDPVPDHFVDEAGYAAIAGELLTTVDHPLTETADQGARTRP